MLSLAIFSYNKDKFLRDMTLAAIESYKDFCDELIVIEDGGSYDRKISDLSDVYVLNKYNAGFTRSVNQGLKIASHEFIACVSNDTFLVSGHIKQLCMEESVASPYVRNQPHIKGFAGSFFVLPRWVLEKVGYLNETMKVFYSDTEYIDRLKKNKVPMTTIPSVIIHHHVSQTAQSTDLDKDDEKHYNETKI